MTLPACQHHHSYSRGDYQRGGPTNKQVNKTIMNQKNDPPKFWRSVVLPFSCSRWGPPCPSQSSFVGGAEITDSRHTTALLYFLTELQYERAEKKVGSRLITGLITERCNNWSYIPPVPDNGQRPIWLHVSSLIKPKSMTTLVFAKSPHWLMAQGLDKHKRQLSQEIFFFGQWP